MPCANRAEPTTDRSFLIPAGFKSAAEGRSLRPIRGRNLRFVIHPRVRCTTWGQFLSSLRDRERLMDRPCRLVSQMAFRDGELCS
ncbi:MAG: hypothetical protein EA381_07505 [Planctomycetaceae bacterium]|nr:MAG: hypothetical protein EA381_07505 [Planctomycetaceae bacterium]